MLTIINKVAYGRRHAFTLLELLVVMGIIVLLVSILLPVLSKSRQYARFIICQGNLRHLGVVFELYLDDNNNRFFGGPMDADWDDWVEIVKPYFEGQSKIMCCPFALKTHAEGGNGVFAAWNDEEGDYGSYGLNAWICDTHKGIVFGEDNYWRNPNTSQAHNVPVLLDSIVTTSWPIAASLPPEFNGQFPQTPTLEEQMKPFCIERHGNGMTNSLFMDWSVRPVGLKELWKLKWNRNFDTNGPWTLAGGMRHQKWPGWLKPLKDY